MKKILSVLLAVSIMATPLVSRVSVATWEYEEETLPQEAEKERSWFQKVLNETKKVGNAGWLSTKEIANMASKGAAWLYELAATNPEFSIVAVLQVLTIFAVFCTRNKGSVDPEHSKNFGKVVEKLDKMISFFFQKMELEIMSKGQGKVPEDIERMVTGLTEALKTATQSDQSGNN